MRKVSRTLAWLLPILVMGLFFAGCFGNRYILVKKQSHRVSAPDNKAEVVATARYKETVANVTVVAYRPPDLCLNQAAGQASGIAASDQEVIKTTCGVWISELERAFAEKGYKVLSWTSLGSATEGTSYQENARRMGVQVLFMVNSLDVGVVDPAKHLKSTVEFIKSNKAKEELGPRPVNERRKNSLLGKIPRDAAIPETQWAATLDVTAIDLETNQSVWFFRETYASKLESNYEWSALFFCDEGRCRISDHNWPDAAGRSGGKTSKIELESTSEAQNADPAQAVKSKLLRKVVRSLVSEFAKGATAE